MRLRTALPGDRTARRAWSVRTHLLMVVGAVTLALFAGSAYAFSWSLSQAQDHAIARLTFQAQRASTSISDGLSTMRQTVEAVASQPGLAAALDDPDGCTLSVGGSGAFPELRLDVVRADGVVFCSSGAFPEPRTAPAHADAEWLRAAVTRGEATQADDVVDAVTGERSIAISAPLPGPEGPAGAVVLLLHLGPSATAMAQQFGGSPRVQFALVDRAAAEILSAPADAGDADGAAVFEGLITAEESGTLDGADGARLVHASADVAGTGWRVHATLPHADVFGDARGVMARALPLALLALLALVVGAWRLNRLVARPLHEVTAAAERASRASDAVHVREAGTAETVALARSFNRMLDMRAGHEAQLEYQAGHDALTGLPNKVLLTAKLEELLRAGVPIAVLNLGIDRFRLVNDAVGLQAGDRLLRDVAERLDAALRPGDTLARFGSDEFVVLCTDVDADGAVVLAERLQAELVVAFRGPLAEITLTATIGIATGSGADTTAGRLLREADTALRDAKRAVVPHHVFDQTMQSRATAHLAIQRDLNRALRDDELVVYYQPLVDVRSGAVTGAEALVRWQHPERGLVPPNDFIPVAEQTGQILAVGEHVLLRACEQAVRWAVSGHRLVISVNVAVAQLRDGGFADVVETTLARTGLAPDQLCLEITESSLMTGSKDMAADLDRLRRLGVHLALDDFGTGYSSLSYLQDLPCDELKIDRSFVSRLSESGRERHLITAITGMAQALGLTVVAEGVETLAQLDLLKQAGCHLAQGYLFSRPVPPEEFQLLLTRPGTRNGLRLPA